MKLAPWSDLAYLSTSREYRIPLSQNLAAKRTNCSQQQAHSLIGRINLSMSCYNQQSAGLPFPGIITTFDAGKTADDIVFLDRIFSGRPASDNSRPLIDVWKLQAGEMATAAKSKVRSCNILTNTFLGEKKIFCFDRWDEIIANATLLFNSMSEKCWCELSI